VKKKPTMQLTAPCVEEEPTTPLQKKEYLQRVAPLRWTGKPNLGKKKTRVQDWFLTQQEILYPNL